MTPTSMLSRREFLAVSAVLPFAFKGMAAASKWRAERARERASTFICPLSRRKPRRFLAMTSLPPEFR